jgi:glycosyltransferase involved in cell wall biosynthesis
MKTDISAVVRTWNSDRTLAKTLCSLRRQTEKIGEIIVVDSGSTDRTREIASRFGCRWLDYPADRKFNYSESLNLGIGAAQGADILIVSSHTVLVYRDIVSAMRANLHKQGAAGVYCKSHRSRAKLLEKDDPARGTLLKVTRAENFHGFNGLSNSCSLIARTCWELHPFDPSMPAAEDQEWAVWFFRNTDRLTVEIVNAGVLYLNPRHSNRKEARDHVVIASRLHPILRSWAAIGKMFRHSAISSLRGQQTQARRSFAIASELLKSRFYLPRYASRYY